jgi:hypothetical protein
MSRALHGRNCAEPAPELGTLYLDINKLLAYGKSDGSLRVNIEQIRKRHYVPIDGIIAAEGRGPMDSDPVPTGLVPFGTHPASVDAACTYPGL